MLQSRESLKYKLARDGGERYLGIAMIAPGNSEDAGQTNCEGFLLYM